MMNINKELFYNLKDALMVEFLMDDINTIELQPDYEYMNDDDFKHDKKLLKAYKTILEYYGVDYGK